MRIAIVLLASACFAQQATTLTGDWVIHFYDRNDRFNSARAQLVDDNGAITGKAGNTNLNGTMKGTSVELNWLRPDGSTEAQLTGLYKDGIITGKADTPDHLPYTWRAERAAPSPSAARTHDFTPTKFERYLSAATSPVLKISPGDTVRTSSVDAGGTDSAGVQRSRGGNPLTGPFYIEGALPGDTITIKLNSIRLNRDWGRSGTGVVSNAVSADYIANQKRAPNVTGRWKLDLAASAASIDSPTEALKNFRVPIHPMLGCVAVAPPSMEVISTRDSGRFGGNMDFNRIREGTTVHLPVFHPGALLFLGDAHAAQGDGELTGDAIETSMDFEFTVDLVRGRSIPMPFAEDDHYWMTIGIAGSLEDALRNATTAMARYLENEHGLKSNEAALVLGFALEYNVADLVGTQVSIVAKLPKATLAQMPPRIKH